MFVAKVWEGRSWYIDRDAEEVGVWQKNIDVRFSTMPIQYGESIVMRLMIAEDGVRNLDQIGINDSLKKKYTESYCATLRFNISNWPYR